jgi:hypothetical protein
LYLSINLPVCLAFQVKIRKTSIPSITGWLKFPGCTLVHRLDFGIRINGDRPQ